MSHTIILPTSKSGSHRTIPLEKSALCAGSTDQETKSGKLFPHLPLANFYVAVKSCPLIILAGPAESGKLTLARLTAHVLGGNRRTSSMPGHARWAAGSAYSGELVEAQTGLNKSALFALIEEAWQSEEQGRPFVACLRRISPAELDTFFTHAGLDLLYRQFLGWRQTSALQLLPLPPNLTLIATIDTERFRWWEAALLNAVTVVPWPAPVPNAPRLPHPGQLPLLCSGSFLRHAVRDATEAHERLRQQLPRDCSFRASLAGRRRCGKSRSVRTAHRREPGYCVCRQRLERARRRLICPRSVGQPRLRLATGHCTVSAPLAGAEWA